MAFMEKINELNNKQRLLVLGIAVVLICAAFYYLVWSPARNQIAVLESRLSALQTDLQGLRAIAAKLPEFKAETARLENQLLAIREKLPLDKEIPGLLDSISRAGIENGLQFDLFKPRGENRKEFYSEVPVDIVVKGPFHNIALFLDKIAHLPRIVNITNFSFSTPKEEGGYIFITGSGLATTYRYNEKT